MADETPDEKSARLALEAEEKSREEAGKALAKARKGKLEVTVRRGRRVDHDGQTYLPHATLWVTPEERKRLLSLGAIVNPDGDIAPMGIGPDFGRENIDLKAG